MRHPVFECAKEADKAAIGKDVIYEKLLRNYIFVPIAVESFGTWGPRGLKFIKEIGRKIQEKTDNIKMHLPKSKQSANCQLWVIYY